MAPHVTHTSPPHQKDPTQSHNYNPATHQIIPTKNTNSVKNWALHKPNEDGNIALSTSPPSSNILDDEIDGSEKISETPANGEEDMVT